MATIEDGRQWLARLAQDMHEDIERGNAARKETLLLRDLLASFGYQMKVENAVKAIESCLDEHGLRTTPELHNAWSGGAIVIERDLGEEETETAERVPFDPTIRITAIDAAHRLTAKVKPDATLQEVMTVMQLHGVDYLPVMPNDYDVKGVITWRLVAEKVARLGTELRANQLMNTNFRGRSIEEPLFDAVDPITKNGFVLVRDNNNKIVGLITANEFTQQFARLTRPFLTIGEIEGYLRRLIRNKFNEEQLREAYPDFSPDQRISPRVLTFGAYVRLLEKPDNWESLGLKEVDRKNFIDRINWVRAKRNEVMHFNPDGLQSEDEDGLTRIVEFLRGLVE